MKNSLPCRVARRMGRLAVSLLTDRRWRDATTRPVWVGSASGGAWVDLSRLTSSSVVYSFGIACEISFDREIIAKTGCRVVGFDPDPRSKQWLESGVWVPPGFEFMPVGLFSESGPRTFYMADAEAMTGNVSHDFGKGSVSCEFLTLGDIMTRRGDVFVDAVKLDIEGSEYGVLEAWLAAGESPPIGQIWVEFHPGMAGHTIATTESFVRSLAQIGLTPAKRVYWRNPNGYLLVNKAARHPTTDNQQPITDNR